MNGNVSQLEADFAMFAGVGGKAAVRAPLAELEAAMAEAGIPVPAAGPAAPQFMQSVPLPAGNGAPMRQQTLSMFADVQDYDLQLFDWFIKGQVASLIQKLYNYVQQYSQLVECVPLVTETVALFKSGSFIKALSKGYDAFRCIKSKL